MHPLSPSILLQPSYDETFSTTGRLNRGFAPLLTVTENGRIDERAPRFDSFARRLAFFHLIAVWRDHPV
jgi:hypothetical protein